MKEKIIKKFEEEVDKIIQKSELDYDDFSILSIIYSHIKNDCKCIRGDKDV